MRCPSSIADEEGRLAALAEYGLSDDVGLPSLDPIVDIAVRMFGVPAAAVNMVGSDHVFFAASAGIGECDKRRDVSFCAHAITQDEVMVVEDAALDPRFHDNPIVQDGLIRFYAGVPLRAPSGHPLGALCVIDSKPHAEFSEADRVALRDLARIASDKLELHRLAQAAVRQPGRFAASAAASPNAVIGLRPDGCIDTWNAAAGDLFGYDARDVVGRAFDLLMTPESRETARSEMDRLLAGGDAAGPLAGLQGLRSDGTSFRLDLDWTNWREGKAAALAAIVRPATDQAQGQDMLQRLVNYDGLTKLPNRNLLHQRVTQALAGQPAAALMMIDLDGFTDINDTLGHAVGDAILRVVADRLRHAIPPSVTAARVGGDEFAVLLTGEIDAVAAERIAHRILEAVSGPVVMDGHETRLTASCGLAFAPQHGDSVETFISSADLALFQAKSRGRGRCFTFVPALRSKAIARRMYDAEIHRAHERGEFVLFYQPKIRLEGGTLTGAEALIRWRHPVRGLLEPADFLPVLEGGSLAATIGRWIIESACAQAAIWRHLHPGFRMSVNLFAAQFRAGDLAKVIAQALETHKLPASALELEITENIVLDHEEFVLPQLQEVRKLGVELSFDDFGTGYGSLNLLKSFPVSHIKIDRSFTLAVQTSAHDRAIVASLLDLSRELGLSVVAEGVETEQQRVFLQQRGCEEAQGFLFSRPVPAELFDEKFWPAL